jgi:hypothetical protein
VVVAKRAGVARDTFVAVEVLILRTYAADATPCTVIDILLMSFVVPKFAYPTIILRELYATLDTTI